MDKVKPLDIPHLIRSAFFAGAGYSDGQRISDEDIRRYNEYDPTEYKSYQRLSDLVQRSWEEDNGR